MTDRELMQMALEMIEPLAGRTAEVAQKIEDTKQALRDRLAQPEPKTNWIRITKKDVHGNEISWFKPKGEWVGLTDEEIAEIPFLELVEGIQAKLKEKNT